MRTPVSYIASKSLAMTWISASMPLSFFWRAMASNLVTPWRNRLAASSASLKPSSSPVAETSVRNCWTLTASNCMRAASSAKGRLSERTRAARSLTEPMETVMVRAPAVMAASTSPNPRPNRAAIVSFMGMILAGLFRQACRASRAGRLAGSMVSG